MVQTINPIIEGATGIILEVNYVGARRAVPLRTVLQPGGNNDAFAKAVAPTTI
jgi:hypothetical protein